MLFVPPLLRNGGLPGVVLVAFAAWAAGGGSSPWPRLRGAVAAGGIIAVEFAVRGSLGSPLDGYFAFGTNRSVLSVVETPVFAAPLLGVTAGVAAWLFAMPHGRGVPLRARFALVAYLGTLIGFCAVLVITSKMAEVNGGTLGWGPAEFQGELLYLAQATAVVIGTVAWVTAGQALRPVDAIRRELEDITLRSLDRRVPVPRSGDELTRLALTTNAILVRLERSTELQQQFIGDASHELRSPVAAVRASLESLLAHPEQVDWPTAVRSALHELERLQGLSEDLLLLARLDGTAAVPREPVNLTDLAHDLVEEHRHLRRSRPLEIRLGASGPPVWVTGIGSQLERMLRNVLSNACRYADKEIEVAVGTERREGVATVRVDVRDDGPGIPAADRERVFERFSRLEDARARRSGGAGLGLAIAREIADHHGGTLHFTDAPRGAHAVGRLPAAGPGTAAGH
ncbi:HAMP domain-containing histidine kinase [Streptomyces sp. NBC_01808]|uniref:sensor histidine kinase n=1 Tax=Streptomyces sp. NBC_01808 TaxID=2975947 RepID=UPI002DD805CD|nr:HAMP domain-containing sensor histidine kinase [Streptomyces sp. NBC_01808]WSA42100.1 HAMP domain-containing histidine kinase [Streptomyces sp. NBC_01808]